MVMAPASTGVAISCNQAVIKIDQTKSGILNKLMPGARMLKIVVMKFVAPRIEPAPARWREKIAKSTAGPGEPVVESGA